jgi:hypothetical protein
MVRRRKNKPANVPGKRSYQQKIGDTKQCFDKGMIAGKRLEGTGQGCAQQHRRDRGWKEEDSWPSAEKQLGDPITKFKSPGSIGQRKLNLEVG